MYGYWTIFSRLDLACKSHWNTQNAVFFIAYRISYLFFFHRRMLACNLQLRRLECASSGWRERSSAQLDGNIVRPFIIQTWRRSFWAARNYAFYMQFDTHSTLRAEMACSSWLQLDSLPRAHFLHSTNWTIKFGVHARATLPSATEKLIN